MKKTLLATICILILSPTVHARRNSPLANAGINGLYAKSIEQVLQLREDEIDIATAALIISENWSDLVPGRHHLATLDEMALVIRDRLDERKIGASYKAVPLINEYLYNELGFKSIAEASNPNDLFLHTVLDKKRGYCLSLSILYLSLAERLGLPLYGVVVPGHFFVRYDDGRIKFNIETTSNGGTADNEHYIKEFKTPRGSNIYMKNLNKIQTLGCFFNNLGNSYYDIDNMDSAMRALETAVQINPSLSEAHSNLGNVYLEMGRLRDAIYQYQQALQINPDDAKAHNNLGNAYIEQGHFNYAISEYHQSLNLDPNNIDAYKNISLAYCKQELYMQAIKPLKQALGLKPKDASLYNNLGDVYSRMGDYETAISQYKKALKIQHNLAEAHFGLAICYNKQGSVNDEIQAYKMALAIEPDMLAALVNLGNAYYNKKDYDAAIELYTKAIQIQPDDGSIHYNLGSSYSNKERYEQAVAAYLKAVEIEPNMGDAHFGLAFAYYNLKNYELAFKHIKNARELGVEVTEDQLNAIKQHLK